MSTLTGGDLNLVKPELTDDHKVTIGTDLPANFQKIDDEFTAHLAEDVTQATVHGLRIQEGTFTPAFSGSTATGVFDYYQQIGNYTKIGKRVFFELTIGVASVTTPASGNLFITGLPFTSKNVSGKKYAANISRWECLPLVANTQLGAYIQENTSRIYITSLQNNSVTFYVDSSGIAANSYVVLSGSYESAV
jgi:hypothetical protein